MATIKSYTDLEQSKKLAEILPIKSADMFWQSNLNSSDRQYLLNMGEKEYFNIEMNLEHCSIGDYDIPCWSLSALLNVLPKIEHLKPFIDLSPELDSDKVAIYYHSEDSPYIVKDNLIDVCYEMILKLHELKIL